MMKFRKLHSDERNLWLIRIHYFLALGGIGLISPYLNLFFINRGLSGLQVGIVLSIGRCFICCANLG
jgi:hypothetical protein